VENMARPVSWARTCQGGKGRRRPTGHRFTLTITRSRRTGSFRRQRVHRPRPRRRQLQCGSCCDLCQPAHTRRVRLVADLRGLLCRQQRMSLPAPALQPPRATSRRTILPQGLTGRRAVGIRLPRRCRQVGRRLRPPTAALTSSTITAARRIGTFPGLYYTQRAVKILQRR